MLSGLMRVLAYGLVPMFVVGMIGSTLVVAITFFHDVIEFFQDDDLAPSTPDPLRRK